MLRGEHFRLSIRLFVHSYVSLFTSLSVTFWVVGSFQWRGVLLLLHIEGQGPAVLAAGTGWVGYIFYIFHLSSLSNVLSFWRQLNMTEILWFCLLNPNGSCQLLSRMSSLCTCQPLIRCKPAQEQCHY